MTTVPSAFLILFSLPMNMVMNLVLVKEKSAEVLTKESWLCLNSFQVELCTINSFSTLPVFLLKATATRTRRSSVTELGILEV